MADIRSNSILPADRREIVLHTADDVRLVGEIAVPTDGPNAGRPNVSGPNAGGNDGEGAVSAPVATLICVHPLPTHGGMMDSHILRKAAWRLPALAGIAVLRFNTRGTSSVRGTSEGQFDEGRNERHDVAAAIEYAEFAGLPAPWLLGWSFGSDLVLRYGCDPGIVGAILLSPPLRSATPGNLTTWAHSGKPVTALVPEFDDYLRPDEARQRFAPLTQAEVVGIVGAKHLWVGFAERVLDEIVSRVAPDVPVPLPRTWDGPMELGDATAYADRTVAAFSTPEDL